VKKHAGKIKFGFGVLIGGLALWYFFEQFNFVKSLDALYNISSLWWIYAAIVSYCISIVIKTIRWWYIITIVEPAIPLIGAFKIYFNSIIINALLPLRAGDILRISEFKKQFDMPVGLTTGCMVSERILDIIVLLFYLFISISFLVNDNIIYEFVGEWFLKFVLVVIVVGVVILAFPLQSRKKMLLIVNISKNTNSEVIKTVSNMVVDLISGLTAFKSYKSTLVVIVLSIIGWGFEGGLFIAVANSMSISDYGFGVWLAFCLATLVQALPNAPAGIGLFQLAVFTGMISFGVSEDEAGMFAILSHVIYFIALFFMYIFFTIFLTTMEKHENTTC